MLTGEISRKEMKSMRLRKGFGTVRKLSGNRRNPYAVHPPKVDGVRPKAICYVNDYHVGVCVLNAWHNGAYYPGMELDLRTRKLNDVVGTYTASTFQSVYDLYWDHLFGESAVKVRDKSSRAGVRSAWLKLDSIRYKTLDEVTIRELQEIVNRVAKEYSKSTVTRLMSLIKGMYHFAYPRELCRKQYGLYVEVPKVKDEEHHDSFTDEEIEKLWEASGATTGAQVMDESDAGNETDHAAADTAQSPTKMITPVDRQTAATVRMILTMIYSGYRIGAWDPKAGMTVNLENMTFTGGVKTDAGKNRVVPIHPSIRDLVSGMRLETGEMAFLTGKSESQFRRDMRAALEKLGIRTLTPHSCRHTFHRLLERAGVNEADRKRLMGHSLKGDITNGVYGHRGIEELRAEIEKIAV